MSRNRRSSLPALARHDRRERQQRQIDERVRRTRARLGSALVELIHERPFNEVTVQEVLDRASVGRSTFYLHFRDKNDLLLSQLETFLDRMCAPFDQGDSHRVLPVAEMFAHIGGQNRLYRALSEAGRLDDFFDLAKGYFARAIEQRLRASRSGTDRLTHDLSACSHALAAGLIALLEWWVARGAKETPRSMDEIFHRMAWNGVQ